jgi:hypothetical protein
MHKSKVAILALMVVPTGCNSMGEAPIESHSAAITDRGHEPVPLKELVIVHPSVVGDAERTSNAADGVWSFRWLMEQLSGDYGTDVATAFVENWLSTFHPENVPEAQPGQLSDRPGVDDLINKWPKTEDGHIDLAQAPFRLLAITNREDLGTSFGDFGEGRFVFGLVDPQTGKNLAMTVIFEFRLPGTPCDAAEEQAIRRKWARRWHHLGTLPFGPAYNRALGRITKSFAEYGGNRSLHQLRTNEIALAVSPMVQGAPPASAIWELREWHLGDDGLLHAANVKNTPDGQFNGSADLAAAIVNHQQEILSGTINLADTEAAPFLGFETHEQFAATRWRFDGVDEPLRKAFAMLTCNGCHNAEQPTLPPLVAGVGFYHVSPLVPPSGASDDSAGSERLSPFVTQVDMPNRVSFMSNLLD